MTTKLITPLFILFTSEFSRLPVNPFLSNIVSSVRSVSTDNHTGLSIGVQVYLGLLRFQYLVYHTQPMSFLVSKSLQIVISNTGCFVLLHLPPTLAACIIWPNDLLEIHMVCLLFIS